MENIPVYLTIINELKEKIALGIYAADEAMPSESAICELYNVSRLTARKALEALMRSGLIYFVAGKGNFVRAENETAYTFEFNEVKSASADIDRIEVADVDIIESTKELVYLLGIHPSNRVLRIKRIFRSGDKPIAFDVKYIPYYPAFPLIEAELEAKDFVQMLSGRISPYSVGIKLEIQASGLNEEEAANLKLKLGGCTMRIKQLLSDNETGIIGYGETCYNPVYCKLRAGWSK